MMGVVRLQTTAWADEMRQPSLASDLPERVEAVGRELLEEAKIASTRPDGWKTPAPRRRSAYFDQLLPGLKAQTDEQQRATKPTKLLRGCLGSPFRANRRAIICIAASLTIASLLARVAS